MEKSEASTLLKQLIEEKESERKVQGKALKEQFHLTYEILKPINIIKSAFKEVVSAPDFKTDIVDTAIGFTTGFLAKKVVIGNANTLLSKLLGVIVEMVVTSKVSKNADGIKSIGSILLEKIINQFSRSEKA